MLGKGSTSRTFLAGLVAGCAIMAVLTASTGRGQDALRSLARRADARLLGGALRERRWGEQRFTPDDARRVPPPGTYDWLAGNRFIAFAHGLGPQLLTGQNTLETLARAREAGFRFFEVDIVLTSDSVLACYHPADRERLDALTWAAIRDGVARDGHTACTFDELVKLASSDSTLHFVLDVKDQFAAIYQAMAARLATEPAAVGRAFIPQIYHPQEAATVRHSGRFAGEIFTSYRSGYSTPTLLDLARELHIRAVALTTERAGKLQRLPSDLAVFVHPVNDPYEGAELRARGVRGIYTGYVSPQEAPGLFVESPSAVAHELAVLHH